MSGSSARRVVITGSTRGIGHGMARELARRGHSVVVSGRSADASARAADQLRQQPGPVFGVACDVTDLSQVQTLWDRAVELMGGVDLWVNNAGQAHETHLFWEQPADRVAAVVDTNLVGTMNGCRVAMIGMLGHGGGAIYNFTGFGRTNLFRPGMAIYGTSKRGVDYFSKALAREAKDTGVIIGQVNPGMVVTDMLREGHTSSVESQARIERIYNILAVTPDEAAPFLVDGILANTRNGALINRQPRHVVVRKLLTGFVRPPQRDVLADA
jgi:NAD(P)-dependent dehydrogenase (short-subunit alcohol dehydrogenase family)